jgi:hypothetical protein
MRFEGCCKHLKELATSNTGTVQFHGCRLSPSSIHVLGSSCSTAWNGVAASLAVLAATQLEISTRADASKEQERALALPHPSKTGKPIADTVMEAESSLMVPEGVPGGPAVRGHDVGDKYPVQKAQLTAAPLVPAPVGRSHPVHLVVELQSIDAVLPLTVRFTSTVASAISRTHGVTHAEHGQVSVLDIQWTGPGTIHPMPCGRCAGSSAHKQVRVWHWSQHRFPRRDRARWRRSCFVCRAR